MKLRFLLLFIIGYASNGYTQELPFDIYCNNTKLSQSSFSAYFVPTKYEFQFKNKEGDPTISTGTITVNDKGKKTELCRIVSNTATSNQTFAYNVEIEFQIDQITKSSDTTVTLIDSTYRHSISFIHTNEMTDQEFESINTNNISIRSKKKDLATLQGFDSSKDSYTWTISNEGSYGKIEKWGLVLVRGIRPVSTRTYTDTSADISVFKNQMQKGDFFRVQITMDYLNSEGQNVVLYKIIKVVQ